jgi:hypothetical protein
MKFSFALLLVCCSYISIAQTSKSFAQFVPKAFVLIETITGDLNKDGREDAVLLIGATNASRIIQDENRGELDRNRRGIIILFNEGTSYKKVLQNDTCLASANEDGGIYFAPELTLDIKKGNLYIQYNHGRYGFWKYTFKYQNNDFALIGYDHSAYFGPIVRELTSINFSTKTKIVKTNTKEDVAAGDEIYCTKTTKIKIDNLPKLSAIKDFEEFDPNSF